MEGSYNYYDEHKGCGTAADKALAARLGGHNYNILSNQDRHEIYMPELRHDEHYVDKKGRHTAHMFGARRRKFAIDERDHVRDCITLQDNHPRDSMNAQRRTEIQLAQIEHSQSWSGFQQRTGQMYDTQLPKRYSIHDVRQCHEKAKLNPQVLASKAQWLGRRGEGMPHSASCPNLHLTAPEASLRNAVMSDARKEAMQRQTESAHFAPWMTANTFSASLDGTPAGREHASKQKMCSVGRLENYDFAIARKNNHYSSHDKLTRADPFFMKPRMGITNNSVKYDIVSNERKWFKY